ncbi:hypothetical protein [Deferrisoma sp.]
MATWYHPGVARVVEFKKGPMPHGPPPSIRLAPEDLARLERPMGFSEPQVTDLGADAYLALFERAGGLKG